MTGLRPVILLPVLALGCAADRGEEAAALMQQALLSAQASRALAGGMAAPAAQSQAAQTPRPTAAAVVPTEPAGPRRRGSGPPAAAAAMVGLRAEEIRRMLGDPSLRRAEGDAEIWLYEAAACRLDVVLYVQGGALVAAHAAARAHGGGAGVTEAACLSAIAAAPEPPSWTGPGRRA